MYQTHKILRSSQGARRLQSVVTFCQGRQISDSFWRIIIPEIRLGLTPAGAGSWWSTSGIWSQKKETTTLKIKQTFPIADIKWFILPFQSEIIHFKLRLEGVLQMLITTQHALCSSSLAVSCTNWRLIFAASSKTQTGWHDFSLSPKVTFSLRMVFDNWQLSITGLNIDDILQPSLRCCSDGARDQRWWRQQESHRSEINLGSQRHTKPWPLLTLRKTRELSRILIDWTGYDQIQYKTH